MLDMNMGTGHIVLPDGWFDIVDGQYVLGPGILEVKEPIRISGDEVHLRGTCVEGRSVTTLRRSASTNGELYQGHLFEISGAQNVLLSDLVIDGNRFPEMNGQQIDRRHPLDSDRSSPLFLSAQFLDAPACFEAEARRSSFSSDFSLNNAVNIRLENITSKNAIGIALAIGPGCRNIELRNFIVSASGDYGIWIGSGLPEGVVLPVPPEHLARLPRDIVLEDCLIERCGAAGLYLEALNVAVTNTTFLQNHWDAPYDDESGQVVIDYKAVTTVFSGCHIISGGVLLRRAIETNGENRMLGTFGIEASGKDLTLKDCIISGNPREGIQLMGARDVKIIGRSRIIGNQQATGQSIDEQRPMQNVSVTTTAELRRVNALAGNLTLNGLRCENGVIIWPHPSAQDIRFDGLTVHECDLSGPESTGICVADSGGSSLRGQNWQV